MDLKIGKLIVLLFAGIIVIGCSTKDIIDGVVDNIGHTITGYWNSTNYDIPDNSSSGVDSNITVDMHTDSFSVSSVTVFINIKHEAAGNLKISLASPHGTSVNLMEYRGGDQEVDKIYFEDNATTSIVNYDKDIHKYKPEVALSSFNGENPNGNWKLHIIDNQLGKTGKVTGWQIKIGHD